MNNYTWWLSVSMLNVGEEDLFSSKPQTVMSFHYMQHNEQGRRKLHTTTLVEAYQQLQSFAYATMLYNSATTPKAIITIMAGRVLESKGHKNQGKLSPLKLPTCQPTNLLTKLLGR